MYMKFTVEPSFEETCIFVLSQNHLGDLTCQLHVYLGKICHDSKQLSVHEVEAKLVDEALNQLMQPTSALLPKSTIVGLDGTTYSLELHNNGHISVVYSWWCYLPKEWESLKPLVDLILTHSGLGYSLEMVKRESQLQGRTGG